jgi:succinate dehydrogenase / fumarate reductase membrane anchor subunit
MAFRTPLARVEGLGAAHSGVEHFWKERVTAAALVPLSVWLVVAGLSLAGQDRETVLAYLHEPIHAVLMVLFVLASVMHMILGIQVVIEDYVHHEGAKIALLLANRTFGWAVGAAAIFAMFRIAL